mmetsp:Transcript_51218/g.83084  ORF Transcript_51218/g.83084 Transcript_51218/m.83084 type:complete len:204 (+) Transcript_51218:167-778(+)
MGSKKRRAAAPLWCSKGVRGSWAVFPDASPKYDSQVRQSRNATAFTHTKMKIIRRLLEASSKGFLLCEAEPSRLKVPCETSFWFNVLLSFSKSAAFASRSSTVAAALRHLRSCCRSCVFSAASLTSVERMDSNSAPGVAGRVEAAATGTGATGLGGPCCCDLVPSASGSNVLDSSLRRSSPASTSSSDFSCWGCKREPKPERS